MMMRLTRPRWILASLVLAGLISPIPALRADVPWNALRGGNPVLPGYFADPCARKFGDTYYIYVTPDGWDVGRGPAGAWSSKDFVHWTFHPMNWPATEFKWAPSVVEKGGKYYMYTSVPCMIYGAVADTPLGPWTSFTEPGKPMIPDQTPKETIVLDGECFIDTDGQPYIWYSTWWRPTVAKLKQDMHTIDGDPIQYFKNPHNQNPPKGIVEHCMEGPYMFKHKDTYYLMYSDNMCQDSSYNVKYSTAKSPLGPFTYDASRNPILETTDDDTVDGPGHHTILEDKEKGKVYIVYHRHDNPHDPDGAHRQTCIDELHFNADGSIEKVEPSHMGVGYLAPSTVRDTNLALGKPATASSSAGPDFGPRNATDENNGTVWKAANNTFPQWLQVDLEKISTIQRVESEFQYAQVAVKYVIETSTDGQTWTTFADHRENTKDVGIRIDKGSANARYVRITIYGNNSGRADQHAALWGFKVYDGIDKPNQAPIVEAGPEIVGTMLYPTQVADGSVVDDGLPNGPVSVKWSKVSGPGEVTFAHADRCRTSVTFGAAGNYVLQLEADDGALKSAAKLNCRILPPGDDLLTCTFDEPATAIVHDGSNNRRHGVIRGAVTRTLGVHDKALNFNTGGYVAIPALGSHPALTVSAWVNVHTLRGDMGIVGAADGGAGIFAGFDRSGALRFARGGPATVSQAKLAEDNLGEWHHVAIAYDGQAAAFYIDGKPAGGGSVAAGGAVDLSAGLRIGNGLDGELDDVKVFAKALAPAQIAELAKAPALAKIADVAKLPDGTAVTLISKAVTLAPHDKLSSARTTNYFYISERDGSAAIRVEDGSLGQDHVQEGQGVSLAGTMKTGTGGERYVELAAAPGIGAPHGAAAREATIKTLPADVLNPLVKITAKVKELAADGKTLTLADPNDPAAELQVQVEKGTTFRKIAAGNTVAVTGVLGRHPFASNSANSRGLLLRDLVRIDPPPPPGLAFYSFDEADGAVAKDSSTSDNNAKLVRNPERVPGKKGTALKFGENRAYVDLPDMGPQPVLTLAAWVNVQGMGKDDFGTSIVHTDGWQTGSLHMIVQKANGRIRAAVGDAGDLDSRFAFAGDKLNQWVHVALVFDVPAHKMAIYINGELDASRDLGPGARPINLQHAKIGSWGDGGRFLDGMVDEFRLYDRALTPAEIAELAGTARK